MPHLQIQLKIMNQTEATTSEHVAPAAVVVGATSGIGREVAQQLLRRGWRVGVCGRRVALLRELEAAFPGRAVAMELDVCRQDAPDALQRLTDSLGRVKVIYLVAGVGWQNPALSPDVELLTVRTNAEGFVRMAGAAFRYFAEAGGGHIAVVSSIAGTRGLGVAPAYAATKRLQNTYVEALEQLARIRHLPVRFTDVRPGFVRTALLAGGRYPCQMEAGRVARLAIRAVERRQAVAVIDWRYAALTALWRLIPRWLWVRLPVHN